MDGLLRRSLSRGIGPSAQVCPEPEILAAYFDRSLAGDEIAACEMHFAGCARCRQQLAAMVRAGEPPQLPKEKAWAWDWRWLVATAAVLALAATVTWRVVGLRPGSVSKNAAAPLVAMSQPEQPPSPPPTAVPAPSVPEAAAPIEEKKAAREELQATTKRLQDEPAARVDALDKKETPQVSSGANERDAAQSVAPPEGKPNSATEVSPQAAAQPAPSVLGGAIGGALQSQNAPAPAPALKQQLALQPASPPSNAGSPPNAPGNASSPTARQSDAAALSARALNYANAAKVQAAEQRSGAILIRTPDAKILWRVMGGGFIERTVDGGATWQGQQLPETTAEVAAGAAPSAKACWLVGSGGTILLTKDAKTWQKIPPPIPADFTAVMAKDDATATITASGGQKFATSDGGKKWTPAQ